MKQPLNLHCVAAFVAAMVWVFTQIAMVSIPLAPGSALVAGETIVICSGDGLKTIILDADGNPIETPLQSVDCPWCAQIGGGDFIPAPYGSIAPAAGRSSKIDACPDRPLVVASASSDIFDSRAPPFLANL